MTKYKGGSPKLTIIDGEKVGGSISRLRTFCRLVAGGEAFEAAAEATSQTLPLRWFRDHPDLIDEMHAALMREMASECVPQAMARMKKLIHSTDERVALAASKAFLDKAIATPKPREVDGDGAVDLERMSQAQLAETIMRLEGELAGRAKDITPDDAAPDAATRAKLLEMLD